jgi:hypothetical protein
MLCYYNGNPLIINNLDKHKLQAAGRAFSDQGNDMGKVYLDGKAIRISWLIQKRMESMEGVKR